MNKIACLLVCYIFTGAANAVVIDFEGFAPAFGVAIVSPTAPYIEDGFILETTNAESFVANSFATSIPGFDTDWFGFTNTNTVSFSLANPANPTSTFYFNSVLIGPNLLNNGVVNTLITGSFLDGSTLMSNFEQQSSATTVTLGWSDLVSVSFNSIGGSTGIDNFNTNNVPAPTPLALVGLGLVGLGLSRSKKVAAS